MKINRRFTFLSAILMATVLSVTSVVPLFADASDTDTPTADIDGLAIIAPIKAEAEETVTMTVLQRSDATAVGEANVWAVSRDNIATVEEEINAITANGSIADLANTDISSILSVHAEYLGSTDANGKLSAVFPEQGIYALVAIKTGYIPGRTHINIGTFLRRLTVSAPDRVDPEEVFTINVSQSGTTTPADNANVWALTRENAEALQTEATAIAEENGTPLTDTEWESLISISGIYLGSTDADGNLQTAFTEEGGYLIIAVKSGFIPGRKGVMVKEIKPTLAISAWRWATTGEEVTMTVTNANEGTAVENASVWALTLEEAEALKAELEAMQESDADTSSVDWESMVSLHGELLGITDGNGELTHAFINDGIYVLVTVKADYLPGRTAIRILEPRTDSADTSTMFDNATSTAERDID